MSRWFITCSTDGSTFFTTFSSWWGSDFRSYTSTNDWREKEQRGAVFPTNQLGATLRRQSLSYLTVCKLAVLQVLPAAEGPDAGVGVVVGVFAHAVWETLLDKAKWLSYIWAPQTFSEVSFPFPLMLFINVKASELVADTHRQSRTQPGARRITRWVSLSGIFHQEKGTRRAVTQRRSLRRKRASESGEKVRKVSDHQLTIWERKDWPSTFTAATLNPLMSSMVGARSMFKTGAWGSQETSGDQTGRARSELPALCAWLPPPSASARSRVHGPWAGPWCRTRTAASCRWARKTDLSTAGTAEQAWGGADAASEEPKAAAAAQTCVVAVVRGEEDVGAVQLVDAVQFLHQLFHHVVHGDQRLPPAGRDSFLEAISPARLFVEQETRPSSPFNLLNQNSKTELWCGRLNPAPRWKKKKCSYRFL